jgi:hypothetical protein
LSNGRTGRSPWQTTRRSASEDAKLISLNDEYEVEYWTRKFGVTTERLVRTVHKVGNSAERISEELKRR